MIGIGAIVTNLRAGFSLASSSSPVDNPPMNQFHVLFFSALLSLSGPLYAAEESPDGEQPKTISDNGTGSLSALYKIERLQAGALSPDNALKQLLPGDVEVLQLESDQQNFFMLHQLAAAAEPKGAVLLLPDADSDQLWVQQTLSLLTQLPASGWEALALQPPKATAATIPKRTLPTLSLNAGQTSPDGEENTATPATDSQPPADATAPTDNSDQQDDNAAPPAPFSERFTDRMDQALAELRKNPTDNLVIVAFGKSVPWAASYIATHADLNLQFMMVDARPDSVSPNAPTLNDELPKLTQTWAVDIYHVPLKDYPQAAPNARMRKALALRSKLERYSQRRFASPFLGWTERMPDFVREVRSALEGGIVKPRQDALKEQMQNTPADQPTGQQPPGAGAP